MPNPLTGHDCKLYRNTATHASPTWNEVVDVEDVSLDLNWMFAELKRRSNRLVQNIATLLKAGLKFKLYPLDTTDFEALRDAFLARTPIEFFVANGASNVDGTQGLRCYFQLENFPINQPLSEVSAIEVTALPTYYATGGSEVTYDWYEISI